jgi:hypothetical protein
VRLSQAVVALKREAGLLNFCGFGFELGDEFAHLVDDGLDGFPLAKVDAGFAQLIHRVIVAAALEKR